MNSDSNTMVLSNCATDYDKLATSTTTSLLSFTHGLHHPQAPRRVSAASVLKSASSLVLKRKPSSSSFVLSSSPTSTKRCKVIKKGATSAKVRFATPDKLVTMTNRHLEMNVEDLPQAWYQPREYAHIKIGILTSIQAISRVFSCNDEKESSSSSTTTHCTLDLNEHCLRGIETGISRELYLRRKRSIQRTVHNVLEQQRMQRFLGISDPQALRAVSIQCSQSAQESAQAMAKIDSQL